MLGFGPEEVIGVLAIVLIFGTPFVAVIGVLGLIALKILKGQPGRKGLQLNSQETKIMQEIYQGLSRLDKRVESLETILLDKVPRKESRKD